MACTVNLSTQDRADRSGPTLEIHLNHATAIAVAVAVAAKDWFVHRRAETIG